MYQYNATDKTNDKIGPEVIEDGQKWQKTERVGPDGTKYLFNFWKNFNQAF